MLSVQSVILVFASSTVAAFSQILLKKSANVSHKSFIRQYLNKNVITGYLLLFVATMLSVWAYATMSYKFGAPLESIGFILTTVLACLILKEKITKKKVLGIALIVIGILVFTFDAPVSAL